MILDAITALKDKNGSSTRAIGKYIKGNFTDLPSNHYKLMTHYLKTMTNDRLLETTNNGYHMIAPRAKRGHGRPPKPKPQEATLTKSSGLKRGRGDPPKVSYTVAQPSIGGVAMKTSGGGRGRPCKNVVDAAASGGCASLSAKPRGRPPKAQKLSGKPRGRTRKDASTAASEQEEKELEDLKNKIELRMHQLLQVNKRERNWKISRTRLNLSNPISSRQFPY